MRIIEPGGPNVAVRASDIISAAPPVDGVDLDDDRLLVERFQSGDPAAFDELYRRHFTRLQAFCRRRVGDPHTAEEIAQETFARAYVALPRLSGERRFYPWLSVVAGRLCVDHHRRMGRLRPTSDLDTGTVDHGGHDDRLVAAVERADLDRALLRIADRHREVLDLRELRGLSYDEIADEMAVTHSTVETLLHRARKALRREYLAVSGDGRLAGLGVLAWASRRLAELRARLGDRLPEIAAIATPAGAGVLTAAVTLLPGAMAPATPQPAPPAVVTTDVATLADDLVPDGLAPEPELTAPRADTTPPPAPEPAPGPAIEAAGTSVYLGGASDRAAEQPERERLGPALIGRDDAGLLADIADGIDTTLERALDRDPQE